MTSYMKETVFLLGVDPVLFEQSFIIDLSYRCSSSETQKALFFVRCVKINSSDTVRMKLPFWTVFTDVSLCLSSNGSVLSTQKVSSVIP